MKAAVQFTFSEEGVVGHTETFVLEISPEVAAIIREGRAPFLAVSILPYDPTVPPTGEVIDLAQLYPDVDSETFRREYMGAFVEAVPTAPRIIPVSGAPAKLNVEAAVDADAGEREQLRGPDGGEPIIDEIHTFEDARKRCAYCGRPEGEPHAFHIHHPNFATEEN